MAENLRNAGLKSRSSLAIDFLKSDFLSRNQLTRTQFRPFALFEFKALTAHYIPLHLNFLAAGANIDVNRRFDRVKRGPIGQMRLLVLGFDRIVGNAAIDVMTIDANTHGSILGEMAGIF
jgi:hypothetical protein